MASATAATRWAEISWFITKDPALRLALKVLETNTITDDAQIRFTCRDSEILMRSELISSADTACRAVEAEADIRTPCRWASARRSRKLLQSLVPGTSRCKDMGNVFLILRIVLCSIGARLTNGVGQYLKSTASSGRTRLQ